MESLALFVDEEWTNLSTMFSTTEEGDHYSIDHGHSQGLFPINIQTPSTNFWSTDHESSNGSESVFMFNEGLFLNYPFTQETSNISSDDTSANTNLSLPTPTYESNYRNNYSDQSSMDFCGMDDTSNNFLSQVFSDDVMEENLCLKQGAGGDNFDGHQQMTHRGREIRIPLKRKLEMPELPAQAPKDEVIQIDQVDQNPKKKRLVSRENNKNKKSAQLKKKNQKIGTDTNGNEGELDTINGGGNVNGQSSTSNYASEDDSNANSKGSHESNGEGALNLNGKTRAGRGAATDPQSLYARKRRERINERLRILQNLVPNGTKVDISTMLEEAVHYVKFLQLQIKLLSSDDMWMYAPIAYNGMDMGLYQKITSSAQ